MIKGRRTKIIILIITGMLLLSVSNALLFKIREELDEKVEYSDLLNSGPTDIILTSTYIISWLPDENFDLVNLEYSIPNNWNTGINQKLIVPIIIFIETSVAIQIFNLITKESQSESQDEQKPPDLTISNLSIDQSHVLGIVEEYLNNNRVCYKQDLVSFIKNRKFLGENGLNHNGIESIIDSLVSKHIIVEGSKLTRHTVLSNLNRKTIYEEIKNNPGIYLNKLSKNLGFTTFLTNWHLSILLKFNMIRKQEFSNQFAYFDSNLSMENDYILQIISREKCNELIDYLKLHSKGCTKTHIAKTLKMHHTTVNKYLQILIDNQLVSLRKFDNKNLNCLNIERLAEIKDPQ